MSSAPLAPDDDAVDPTNSAAGVGTTAERRDDEGIDAVTESTVRPGGTDLAEADAEATPLIGGEEVQVDPPNEAEPEVVELGAAEPEAAELEATEPEATEPEVVLPEAAEPDRTDPMTPAPPAASGRAPRTLTVRKGGKRAPRSAPATTEPAADKPVVLALSSLTKHYGDTVAVDRIDLEVREGSFYGIIGPNGAGKTTTLSMMTGLLRPDSGTVLVHGVNVWSDPSAAKKLIGVLPDRLRLFDRLTGAQLLYYSATLRGMDRATARSRTAELAQALGLQDALGRLVSDYSAGMAKKVALAAGMIHAPRILVLDEPFESVDPVSASNVIEVLKRFVASGGTVVLSSHGMDFIERVCDSVAIIVGGKVLAAGTVEEVAAGATLEERFLELAGSGTTNEGLEWLHDFSD